MPGGKNKKKGAEKQAHGQSQNMTPGTEKPGPDKNKSPDVETGLVASKSPSGEKRIELTPAEEFKESAAASEMPHTKADNKQESPVFGGASPMEQEKTYATEGDSEPKLTASEENVAKADDIASKVKVEVKEEKELSETLAQSPDKAVDHKVSQPSDDTDSDMMPETDQIKDNNDSPKLDSPALMALAKSPEANKDSPNKIVSTQGSTQASDHGKLVFKVAETFSDTRREEYHRTRQAAIMQERDKYLAMAPKDKRKFYGERGYVTLDQIYTWPDYYADNEKNLRKVRPDANLIQMVFKGGFANYEADDEINAKVSILEGDITALEIDGIVNAANSSLLGGGGIDGSIHRAAGSQLLEECRLLAGCKTGDAKTTCGYRLPAKYVIHTVGPKRTNPGELRSCYARCLDEMLKYKMRTIAFCCISTGIYGYPNDLAVHVALATVRGFLSTLKQKNQLHSIDRVIFCLFLQVDLHEYQKWMQAYFSISGANGADKRVSDKGIPDKTTKDGKDEEKPKSLASTETTSPSKEGLVEDKLKLSTSGQEPASMELEEPIASEEDMDADMDAEDGNTSSIQVGGTETSDKRCKLDAAMMPKVDMV